MQRNHMLHCWNALSQTTTINRHLLSKKPSGCFHGCLSPQRYVFVCSFSSISLKKTQNITTWRPCRRSYFFPLSRITHDALRDVQQKWRKADRMLTNRAREVQWVIRLINRAGFRKEVVFPNTGINDGAVSRKMSYLMVFQLRWGDKKNINGLLWFSISQLMWWSLSISLLHCQIRIIVGVMNWVNEFYEWRDRLEIQKLALLAFAISL